MKKKKKAEPQAKKYNKKQLKMGMEVEKEHGSKFKGLDVTKDKKKPTAKIAKAHLTEIPDYYTRLNKMEDKAKKQMKKKKKGAK